MEPVWECNTILFHRSEGASGFSQARKGLELDPIRAQFFAPKEHPILARPGRAWNSIPIH